MLRFILAVGEVSNWERMFKLTYISTYPPTHCGIAEYTKFLVTALKSVRPDVKIHVLSDKSNQTFKLSGGVEVHPVFEFKANSYQSILDELTLIGGVDVLHVQHEYGIFGYNDLILEAALEAKREKLVKSVIFTLHSVYHPLSGNDGALDLQKKLNSVDAVIVHSYLMEFELQNQGLDPLLIRRIPHGTHLNPFLETPRHELLNELQLKEDDISGMTLVTPGFLRIDKGLDLLIQSINNLDKKDSMTLIIAGEKRLGTREDKEMFDFIEDACKRLNIILVEKYLSSEEILKLAALADIIILPYRDRPALYSVSGILHLSMGSFKPLLGTRVPRLIELYQFAPRATVPPKKPEQLSKTLRWYIRNYEHMVAYMANLYSYAVRTQWIRMARRHIKLYRETLAT